MVCISKITTQAAYEKKYAAFLSAIGFTIAVEGISVSKNSLKNQIQ